MRNTGACPKEMHHVARHVSACHLQLVTFVRINIVFSIRAVCSPLQCICSIILRIDERSSRGIVAVIDRESAAQVLETVPSDCNRILILHLSLPLTAPLQSSSWIVIAAIAFHHERRHSFVRCHRLKQSPAVPACDRPSLCNRRL